MTTNERRLARWCLLVCFLFTLVAGQASALLGGVWIVVALGFGDAAFPVLASPHIPIA